MMSVVPVHARPLLVGLAALFGAMSTPLAAAPLSPSPQRGGSDRDAPSTRGKAPADPATNARLQLKLDAADRTALERNLSAALPPVPAEGVTWLGSEPLTLEAMRGRVLVLQSLSTRASWKSVVEQLRTQLKDLKEPPVVFLVHTPEGADNARKLLEPALGGWIALIDADGAWCDELGIWKRPVNLVVDRNGAVRYAGLTPEGVRAAVDILNEEKADPDRPATPRADEPDAKAAFPEFSSPVDNAIDRRGAVMPSFVVDSWLNGRPDPGSRLIVIDFWATWCGPCRAAIPHMNALADRFGTDACFVGLSDETRSDFEQGCRKHDLKEREFRYALALDPKSRIMGFFGVKGIPHCAVVSSDGVVRWQGRPSSLTDDVMQKLVSANRALASAPKASNRGWKESKGSKQGGGGREVKKRSY